jgi:hypothetical protein
MKATSSGRPAKAPDDMVSPDHAGRLNAGSLVPSASIVEGVATMIGDGSSQWRAGR